MKIFLSILLVLTCSLNLAFSNEYQLGVVLGNPTGISGKVEMGNNRAIDAVLAYSLANDFGLMIHTDYLIEKAKTFSFSGGLPMDLFYGIGARFVMNNGGADNGKIGVGLRAPVGLTMQVTGERLELFSELALALDLIPSTTVNFEGGLGIRYKFE